MNLWLRLVWALLSFRSRAPLGIWDLGVRKFRIWPTDLDIFNHLNNGKYGSLMDLSRFDILLRSGAWKKLRKLNWYPVVVAETLTFRKSLALWQTFTMESRIEGWDSEGFYARQRFVVADEIYAEAWVRLRFLVNPRGIVTPDQLFAEFGAPSANREVPQWVIDWAKTTALPKGKQPAPSIWDNGL